MVDIDPSDYDNKVDRLLNVALVLSVQRGGSSFCMSSRSRYIALRPPNYHVIWVDFSHPTTNPMDYVDFSSRLVHEFM